MLDKPYVGQQVKLSRKGYASLKLESPEAHEAAKSLTITSVKNVGYQSNPVWDIHVDNPLIDMYMLNQECFDPLESSHD